MVMMQDLMTGCIFALSLLAHQHLQMSASALLHCTSIKLCQCKLAIVSRLAVATTVQAIPDPTAFCSCAD
eukprot:8437230-Karenia_brevis.AAC.1